MGDKASAVAANATAMTLYGYYPGCSLHGVSREYDLSIRTIASPLGIELKEIPDWNCCGASPAHWLNECVSLYLCQRNFDLAVASGLNEVFTPCAACYNRLKHALQLLRTDTQKKERLMSLSKVKGLLPQGVFNLVEVLGKHISDHFQPQRPLSSLKVACYYGCLLLRPKAICSEVDPENPTSMERLVRQLGAETVDWPFRTECCGASAGITDIPKTKRLVNRIVQSAKKAGADLITVACPLCHVNLESRQKEGMPVLYLSQLVGLALGIGAKDLGLDRLLIDPRPLFKRKGVI